MKGKRGNKVSERKKTEHKAVGGSVMEPGAYKKGGEAHGKEGHHRADKKSRGGKTKNWIKGAIKHPGAEKKAAAKAGESTYEYMEEHKGDSGTAGKRARLGLTLSKMSKHKHKD